MKSKYASIAPEYLEREQAEAREAEAKALAEYQRVREDLKTPQAIVYELLEIYETARIHVFRLENITSERLAFEKVRAEEAAVMAYRKFMEAKSGEGDESISDSFLKWRKALVFAVELGIVADASEFVSQAAFMLDAALTEAQCTSDPQKMAAWQELYGGVMKTFSRLGVGDTQVKLALIFGDRRRSPVSG